MKAEPWIAHFKKTVGQPSLWGCTPKPVVITPAKKSNTATSGAAANMALTVVSPMEQVNEMAEAEMKTGHLQQDTSLGDRPKTSAPRKRKLTAAAAHQSKTAKKKVKRVKDIFSSHGKQ